MAKLAEIDSSKPVILLGVKKGGDTATLIDGAEVWVGDSAGFIKLMKTSKFSQALEGNLQDISKMSEDGNVLTTWIILPISES